MTAQEIVNATRNLITEFKQVPFRDGFTADAANTESISILSHANLILRKLSYLGWNKATVTQVLTAASGVSSNHEYTLDTSVIRIVSTVLLSPAGTIIYPMEEMDDDTADKVEPFIQYNIAARPNNWFSRLNQITVSPKPDAAYTLSCKVHKVATDMAEGEPSASPSGLPGYFHDAIVFGAAILISAMQLENRAASDRVASLMPIYDSYVDELASVCRTTPEPARIRLKAGEQPYERLNR